MKKYPKEQEKFQLIIKNQTTSFTAEISEMFDNNGNDTREMDENNPLWLCMEKGAEAWVAMQLTKEETIKLNNFITNLLKEIE